METSIEISYGEENIYITNQQELENYISFLMFLMDNNIISRTPSYESNYYSTNKKIVLRTYFINTHLFPKVLDKYKDIGFSPIIQAFLFIMLSIFCKVKIEKQGNQEQFMSLFVRTYENV